MDLQSEVSTWEPLTALIDKGHIRAKSPNPSNSGLCRIALTMDSRMKNVVSTLWSSAESKPTKPCKKPMIITIRSAKKLHSIY